MRVNFISASNDHDVTLNIIYLIIYLNYMIQITLLKILNDSFKFYEYLKIKV